MSAEEKRFQQTIIGRLAFSGTRELVKTVLSRAVAHKWQFQGFGMFRLYLSDELRLHVWLPELAVKNVTSIHNHPWDFESFVISGVMRDARYRKVFGKTPNHVEQQIKCGPGTAKSSNPPLPVSLNFEKELVMRSGEVYRMTRDVIHESEPESGTITLIRRTFYEDREHAYVYHEIGSEWIPAEPRDATLEEIGHMADVALTRMRAEEKEGIAP